MRKGEYRLYHIYAAKGYVNSLLNRFLPVESVFRKIYHSRKQQNLETVSGPGSTLEQTAAVAKIISSVVHQYEIKRILDIPCGDFNWMKHVDLSGVFYHGADILNELVELNQKNFGGKDRLFETMDLLRDNLTAADVLLCRDCLVHFSFKHIRLAIANIKRSGATYLLTTTFPGQKNRDITTGDWFMLNLQAKPFAFPEPLQLFNEGFHDVGSEAGTKSLGLWRVRDLP